MTKSLENLAIGREQMKLYHLAIWFTMVPSISTMANIVGMHLALRPFPKGSHA